MPFDTLTHQTMVCVRWEKNVTSQRTDGRTDGATNKALLGVGFGEVRGVMKTKNASMVLKGKKNLSLIWVS